MAQHLKAHESESRLIFWSSPPPEPKCTLLVQKPLARSEASMSPTVPSATPSPCRIRNCCPMKRRKGLVPSLSESLARILTRTASYRSAYGSPLGKTGSSSPRSGVSSSCQISGIAWDRMVSIWGSVSIPSPESGRSSVSTPRFIRSRMTCRMDVPFVICSLGHKLAHAFQMLKPSDTRETAKLEEYCMIMFTNALYSACS
mmetsp:Transcript_52211/g.117282  ORF Transcript_52211/g.117282 Transcript_52211/m.117282 type:complete len:201 (-) Transcript_52211:1708-2310(-)